MDESSVNDKIHVLKITVIHAIYAGATAFLNYWSTYSQRLDPPTGYILKHDILYIFLSLCMYLCICCIVLKRWNKHIIYRIYPYFLVMCSLIYHICVFFYDNNLMRSAARLFKLIGCIPMSGVDILVSRSVAEENTNLMSTFITALMYVLFLVIVNISRKHKHSNKISAEK